MPKPPSRFPAHVVIREVGLRDGLQSIQRVLPTAQKIEWIRDAHAAGQSEIEVGSFVPARLLPQLADTAELVAWQDASRPFVSVLVPNLKGGERAIESGADLMLVRSRQATRTVWPISARPRMMIAESGGFARARRRSSGSHRRRHQYRVRLRPGRRRPGRSAALHTGPPRRRRRSREHGGHGRLCRRCRQSPVEKALKIAGDRFWCGHFRRAWSGARRVCGPRARRRPFRRDPRRHRRLPHAPGAAATHRARTSPTCFSAWASTPASTSTSSRASRQGAGWLSGEALHGTLWHRSPQTLATPTRRHLIWRYEQHPGAVEPSRCLLDDGAAGCPSHGERSNLAPGELFGTGTASEGAGSSELTQEAGTRSFSKGESGKFLANRDTLPLMAAGPPLSDHPCRLDEKDVARS